MTRFGRARGARWALGPVMTCLLLAGADARAEPTQGLAGSAPPPAETPAPSPPGTSTGTTGESSSERTGVAPNIGLSEADRRAVADILEARLADEYALYTLTWNYHWNVQGIEFAQLHEFFGKQYEALAEMVDVVAERQQALGFQPAITRGQYLEVSRTERVGAEEMLQRLLAAHEAIIRQLRADAITVGDEHHDLVTQNMMLEWIAAHEKMAWMLRAHLAR